MAEMLFPCVGSCGISWPSRLLSGGMCMNCEIAGDGPEVWGPADLGYPDDKNCVSCGRMHNRAGELCLRCDDWAVTSYDRVFGS